MHELNLASAAGLSLCCDLKGNKLRVLSILLLYGMHSQTAKPFSISVSFSLSSWCYFAMFCLFELLLCCELLSERNIVAGVVVLIE